MERSGTNSNNSVVSTPPVPVTPGKRKKEICKEKSVNGTQARKKAAGKRGGLAGRATSARMPVEARQRGGSAKLAASSSGSAGLRQKKIVVLDLDETLVSAITPHEAVGLPPEVKRGAVVFGTNELFIFRRPGLREFLSELERKFTIVIWTAGTAEYAKLVNEEIVSPCLAKPIPKSRVFHRKQVELSEAMTEGMFHKDLNIIGHIIHADPSTIFIIDNRSDVFVQRQPGSAIQIADWIVTEDPYLHDRFLHSIMKLIEDGVF